VVPSSQPATEGYSTCVEAQRVERACQQPLLLFARGSPQEVLDRARGQHFPGLAIASAVSFGLTLPRGKRLRHAERQSVQQRHGPTPERYSC
jgi:hypothetical protein